MFERFTSESRQVVVRAQEISRKRKIAFVPSEHVLIAILEQQPELWGLIDEGLEIVRVLEAANPEGAEEPRGHIPFTPNVKKGLEMALREALAASMNTITPGLLLLGLLRLPESGAGQALTSMGVEIETARTIIAKAGESLEIRGTERIQTDSLSEVMQDLESVVSRLKNLLN